MIDFFELFSMINLFSTYSDCFQEGFNETEVSEGMNKRVIKQFHFTSWPDHGVPTIATGLLEFQSRLRDHQPMDEPTKNPILVHCR